MAQYLCKRSRYGYDIITSGFQTLTCVLLQFVFVRAKDQDGLYEICHVTTIDIEWVEKDADRIIEKNEACNGWLIAKITMEFCFDYQHHPDCPKNDTWLEDILDHPQHVSRTRRTKQTSGNADSKDYIYLRNVPEARQRPTS